ncbi:MAG: M23 family metallopeptidase [Betaproteobacteria bacterium]|nr:M23 family metallopeptidase [Betaproteobacteria bacterium]
MHIILVSDRLVRARSLAVTPAHLVFGALAIASLVVALAGAAFYYSIRHAAQVKLPLVESMLLSAHENESRRSEDFLRENLNAMAIKLGQMQAQLVRLDALGERLSSFAGLKPQEFRFSEAPGRGGAVSASFPPQDLSMQELGRHLDEFNRQMENRTDYLGIVESTMFDARIKKKLMPTMPPVEGNWNASSFGWRIDPITGQQALHEGVDFLADVGTPIVAAAGGVVVAAEKHSQYGNMIDIDHGNDLITRYGHASRLDVRAGDVVRRGQKIAEVGSTGRSTGPHLHFEVRFKGVAQNPNRFLRASAK